MNTHSVFGTGTRSIKSATLATLCAGALALTACGGGGSGSGMSTFCERVVTLGHTVTAAQNLPDYKDLSKGETKTLISEAHGVAKAAPAEIKDAATALSNQIEMAAADGSEDDVKLQSAGDAIDSYAGDHCTEAGAPDDSSSCIRDSAGNCDPSNGFDQINQVP